MISSYSSPGCRGISRRSSMPGSLPVVVKGGGTTTHSTRTRSPRRRISSTRSSQRGAWPFAPAAKSRSLAEFTPSEVEGISMTHLFFHLIHQENSMTTATDVKASVKEKYGQAAKRVAEGDT